MVRAPCCEKMGLKKGPWTPEEDQVLVDYIHRHGHANWRALPKQAGEYRLLLPWLGFFYLSPEKKSSKSGLRSNLMSAGLLRCGKSCRLRWVNYLRPDIKRGNFSREEQETIIRLHGMLGNRWSAIAAKLAGRTDNEIKNVWHTHLKKLVFSPNMSSTGSKRTTTDCSRPNRTALSQPLPTRSEADHGGARLASTSPEQSYSDFYSFATGSSGPSGGISNVKEEGCSSQELQDIDEGFWLDTLSMDEPAAYQS
ncbi:hypothetical protein GW17_00034652 [Ensete ventricosum]|nr:hypothetical protein GW17_00034652 [Ensete ventricosum]